MKDEDWEEYLRVAQESAEVGGHSGYLGTMVFFEGWWRIEEEDPSLEAAEPSQQWIIECWEFQVG